MDRRVTLIGLLLLVPIEGASAAEDGARQPALIDAGQNEQMALLCLPHQVQLTPYAQAENRRLRSLAPTISGGVTAYDAGSRLARSGFPIDSEAAKLACTRLVREYPATFEFFDIPDPPAAKLKKPAVALPTDIAASLRTQIQSCWQLPVGWSDPGEVAVTIRFALNLDGTVDGVPSVEQYPSTNYGTVAAEGAIRALLQCGPYKLPAALYPMWQVVQVRLRPDL